MNQMQYRVVYPFIENGKKYWHGDVYVNEDAKRIKELASVNNKLKRVLIAPIKQESKKTPAVETKNKVDGAPEIKKGTDTK